MIKKRIKKVYYKVWDECECGGKLTNHSSYLGMNTQICEDCGERQTSTQSSPRIIEEYEEIDE